MKYFVANWKANKNLEQASLWIDMFIKELVIGDRTKVVICPPYHLLYPLAQNFKRLKNIYLGAQNISIFDNGSFTGEVTARMLAGLVQYSIIGHSERRKYFNETDDDIEKKIIQAQKYHIQPILCVRDGKDKIPPSVKIVAYEPVGAIGTGLNEEASKVLAMKQKLNLFSKTTFLYGGSVDENNTQSYLKTGQIDGFLIGGNSLDPIKFSRIISLSSKG